VCLLGALAGCARSDTITVTLKLERESLRPEHVELWWTTPDGRERQDIRVPRTGALEVHGARLATVVVDMKGAPPGERKVIAWGMRGTDQVSVAAGKVMWTPGHPVTLALVMVCLRDLPGLPRGPGQPPRDACAPASPPGSPPMLGTDASPAPDAPVRPPDPIRDAAAPDTRPEPDARRIFPRVDAAALDVPVAPPPDARAVPPDAPPPPPPPDAPARKLDAQPLPPDVDLLSGMVAYFRLDEGRGFPVALDSSPNTHIATLERLDVADAWVPGFTGTAVEMGGQGWLAVGSSSSLNSIAQGFTLSVFVNRTANGTLLARRAVGAHGFLYRLAIVANDLTVAINSSNGARAELTGARPVPLRTWVHLAAVYDRATVRLYIGGINVGQQRYELGLGPENSPLLLGASQDEALTGGDDRLHGALDEVAVYNRPLSDAEIAALAAGFTPPVRSSAP
jgi:hypothetical protein